MKQLYSLRSKNLLPAFGYKTVVRRSGITAAFEQERHEYNDKMKVLRK